VSLLNPVERTARGAKLQAELTGVPTAEPATLVQASWRDYVYAEVWARPALDLRSRFLIATAAQRARVTRRRTERYVRVP